MTQTESYFLNLELAKKFFDLGYNIKKPIAGYYCGQLIFNVTADVKPTISYHEAISLMLKDIDGATYNKYRVILVKRNGSFWLQERISLDTWIGLSDETNEDCILKMIDVVAKIK